MDSSSSRSLLAEDKQKEKEDEFSERESPSHLFGIHFSALFTKRAIYAQRDRRMIFCQLVLPVLLVIIGVSLLLLKPNLNQPDLLLSGGSLNSGLDTKYRNFVPFSIDGSDSDSFAAQIRDRFNNNPSDGVYAQAVPIEQQYIQDMSEDEFGGCALGPTALYNMSQYVLKSVDDPSVDNEKGSSRYGAITIAASTNESNLFYNVMVNGSAMHGVGIYMNEVHQAFLQIISGTPTAYINAHNHPLPETWKQKNDAASADAFVVALFAMIAYCFIPASFAVFVVKEREVKAKHQQVISGVSIYAYWISTYLWDYVSYLPTAGLIIIVMYIYDVKAYVSGSAASAFAVLFLLYGSSTAAFTYIMSFLFVRFVYSFLIIFVGIDLNCVL